MNTVHVLITIAMLSSPAVFLAEDLGRLSTNPYDPDSIGNRYRRCGPPLSPESMNNLFWRGRLQGSKVIPRGNR